MNERGAGEPGHERRILHRIPEPPAAPTEGVVGPPAAQRDADGEECPCNGCPRTRPACPRGVETATEQGSDGKRECDREPDVAHVEQRRMEYHARILKQRIQVATLGRGRYQPLE